MSCGTTEGPYGHQKAPREPWYQVKSLSSVTPLYPNPSDVSSLMGHKEGRGVTIMTPAASGRGDETRSSRTSKSRHHNAIHTIKK